MSDYQKDSTISQMLIIANRQKNRVEGNSQDRLKKLNLDGEDPYKTLQENLNNKKTKLEKAKQAIQTNKKNLKKLQEG